jgi:hypothetical protein
MTRENRSTGKRRALRQTTGGCAYSGSVGRLPRLHMHTRHEEDISVTETNWAQEGKRRVVHSQKPSDSPPSGLLSGKTALTSI